MKRLLQLLALILALLAPATGALALNYGSGTYGSCQYGTCSLSLSSSGSVTLNLSPTGAGVCTTQSDTVSVFTDNSAGFSLTLADNTSNTSLVSGANSIPATTGTYASPIALTVNKWGYRVDNQGGFGAGPTSAQSNVALNSTTYAGVQPSTGTADTIVTTSSPADPQVDTLVWYSVCADTIKPPGAYTTLVTYTAVTN